MNTLGYVARQFDVLASQTPPSTPTSDRFSSSKRNPDDASLQRVNTWSTKSFLFPPPQGPTRSYPKRSHSSPSFHNNSKASHSGSTPSPSPSPSLTSPDPLPPRSKPHLESVINQIFFIRVFLVVWDNLKVAWTSFVDHLNALNWRRAAIAIEQISSSIESEKGKTRALEDVLDTSDPSAIPSHSTNLRYTPEPIHLKSDSRSSTPSPLPLSSATTYQHQQYQQQSSSTASTPFTNSRSATPVLNAKKTPFHLPKTLVLDLDETLIHSTSRPIPLQGNGSGGGTGFFGLASFGKRNKGAGHMVEVYLGGRSTLYHVYKRPFVDFFLRTVSGWYTLVIFTASMQEYADPVIDWLDAGTGILTHRFFRDSCTQLPNGSYTKDLSVIEGDLSRICLVDNSPVSYSVNEANGIPIEGWTHDPSDEALLDLLPVLDSLRFTSDVRRVLGLRVAGAQHHHS